MDKELIWIRLAEQPVCLVPAHSYIKERYKDYLIAPTEQDCADYAAWRAKCGDKAVRPMQLTAERIRELESAGYPYPPEIVNEFALYAKIVEDLLCCDIVRFHSSALKIDGKAYLFTAPSGTGKSTHTRLWRERFGSRVMMIDDDKPLLRFLPDGGVRAYGGPYGGKEHIRANISAPVGGIVVLQQAPENRIKRLSARDAYPHLLRQVFKNPKKPEDFYRAMDLTYRLAALPVYELHCTPTQQAVELAYAALIGE